MWRISPGPHQVIRQLIWPPGATSDATRGGVSLTPDRRRAKAPCLAAYLGAATRFGSAPSRRWRRSWAGRSACAMPAAVSWFCRRDLHESDVRVLRGRRERRIIWQGPHHVAVKSTTTTCRRRSRRRTRPSFLVAGRRLSAAAGVRAHLDVVVRERAAVLELLARENQCWSGGMPCPGSSASRCRSCRRRRRRRWSCPLGSGEDLHAASQS